MLQFWLIANTVLWSFTLHVGGLTLQLNVILLLLTGTVWLIAKKNIAVSSIKVLIGMLMYVTISFAVAWSGPCTDKFQKSMISAPILLLLVLMGMEIGRRATDTDWLALQATVPWTFVVACSGFLAEFLAPGMFPNQAGYRATWRLSGHFGEPSVVGLSLFPCIALLLISPSEKTRRYGIWAIVGLLIVSRSSTLIGLTTIWLLYRLWAKGISRKGLLLGVGISGVLATAALINYDALVKPTMIRIAGVGAGNDADNLSSLVYVQGWEDAWQNLKRTHGLGLGFNMMGCHPLPDVPARMLMEILWPDLTEINSEDGSILFGKAVSEAGIMAIAFYLSLIVWWIRLERRLSQFDSQEEYSAASVRSALIFCFLASSFIRSSGYFNGPSLLWVAALGGDLNRRGGLLKDSSKNGATSHGVHTDESD